jgi:hypothetical protein
MVRPARFELPTYLVRSQSLPAERASPKSLVGGLGRFYDRGRLGMFVRAFSGVFHSCHHHLGRIHVKRVSPVQFTAGLVGANIPAGLSLNSQTCRS